MWWMVLVLGGAHAGNPCSALVRRPLTDTVTYRAAWVCMDSGCFEQLALGRLKDGSSIVVATIVLQPGVVSTPEPQWSEVRSVDLVTEGGRRVRLVGSKVVRVNRVVDAGTARSAVQLHIQSELSGDALAVLVEERVTDAEVVLEGAAFGNSRLLFVPRGSRRRLQRAAQCLARETVEPSR